MPQSNESESDLRRDEQILAIREKFAAWARTRIDEHRGDTTLEALARQAGVSDTTMDNVRHVRESWPRLPTIKKIARALGDDESAWSDMWSKCKRRIEDANAIAELSRSEAKGLWPEAAPPSRPIGGALGDHEKPAPERKPRHRRWLVIGAVIAVMVLATAGAWWQLSSDPSARDLAVPLMRYQAPPPGTANTLSVTGDPHGSWETEPALAFAYEPDEDRVPGLIAIYLQRCIRGCGEDPVHAFSVSGSWQNWERVEVAFRCFNPEAAPEGTQPLTRLMNDKHARTWALRGTSYYDDALSQGFQEVDRGEPLCHVWPPDAGSSS